MRRLIACAGIALALLNCARDWDAFRVQGGGLGGAAGSTSTGGGGVGGGSCFPGAKVCPLNGELICLGANIPENGCQNGTACDPCALPHAHATCSDQGDCATDTCVAPFANCNGVDDDGCEINVETNPSHCGSCSLDCRASQGPGWICVESSCVINECCPNGTPDCVSSRNCDGDQANGCEVDVRNDSNNCGACGAACELAHATANCFSGDCAVGLCDAGWTDCDGLAANGCETNIGSDAANCSACGKKCNAANGASACVGGACAIACFAGWANCNGNVEADGCEINTATDQANCGACGNACNAPAGGSASCTGGQCTIDCGSLSACGASAACFDTDKDPTHCGPSCTVCPGPSAGAGSATCTAGTCGIACGSPTPDKCGTGCYNLSSDPTHCGNCTTTCSSGSCASGVCS